MLDSEFPRVGGRNYSCHPAQASSMIPVKTVTKRVTIKLFRMARNSNGLWPLPDWGFSFFLLLSPSDVGRRRRRGVVLGAPLVRMRRRRRLVAAAAHGQVRHGDVAHGGHERALVADRLVRGGDGALQGRGEVRWRQRDKKCCNLHVSGKFSK